VGKGPDVVQSVCGWLNGYAKAYLIRHLKTIAMACWMGGLSKRGQRCDYCVMPQKQMQPVLTIKA
jgi:hypothetical protein